MITSAQRERIAEILTTVASDGLDGPRDLDVALDAIEQCVYDNELKNLMNAANRAQSVLQETLERFKESRKS